MAGAPFRQLAIENSPYRAVIMPHGVTVTSMLAKCDPRVPVPPLEAGLYLVELSWSEAGNLRDAAGACRSGAPLPERTL